ncbi:MAG: condensation domain-containing protein, partial [Acidobacteria bacterium]|nr:condensation domain-containing protein [Acidobacteriota bacterium]
ARLRERPGILESVVLLREDAPGDKRLVAYVVASGPGAGGESDVKDFLRSSLPDFMVPASVVFLKRLPLTPNGKVDRRALPAPEIGSRDANQGATAPRNAVEQALASIWQQVLRLDAVGVHDNFFHLGGDSILAIQIVARANRAGLRLTPRQLFQNQTVAELAGVVDASTAPGLEETSAAGPVPLTPIESWFFEEELTDVEHYNQAILLATPDSLDVRALEEAVAAIVAHHDALRLRFRKDDRGWHQELPPADAESVFSSAAVDASDPSALESAATAIQSSLNLERGPLVRFVLFDGGSGEKRLLIAIHHLAVDGVSWGVILEDLETAYGQRSHGAPIALPPRTTSFAGWARRLDAHARSSVPGGEVDYWTLPARSRAPRLPVDFDGSNSVETEGTVEMALTAEETGALLRDVPAAYGTQINDALLTALLRATEGWTSSDSLLVDLEGHGREEILEGANLSRTVGWFTTRFPVLLSSGGRSDLAELLKHVKEQLRAVPQRGIGYGLLRYSSGKPEVSKRLRELPQTQISFNYLGQLDSRYSERSMFRPAAGSVGATRSRRQKRRYLISLDGSIRDGRVGFSWSFSEAVHRRETIETLARRFTEALRDLIAHCVAPDAGGYTPSDFPKARLSQRGLDKLLSRFGAAEDKP